MRGFGGKTLTLLAVASLAAGVVTTALGVAGLLRTGGIPFTPDGFSTFLGFILCAAALLVVVGWRARVALPVLLTTLVAAICLATGTLGPLLVVACFMLGSTLTGRAALLGVGLDPDGRSWTHGFLVGAGLYATAVALVSHVAVNYPAVYMLAVAAPIVVRRRDAAGILGRLIGLWRNGSDTAWWRDPVGISTAVMTVFLVLVAILPEGLHDALAVHLVVPTHMSWVHQWSYDPTLYIWALMPMFGDWLFSICYLLGGETAARFLNLAFVFVISIELRSITRWMGGSDTAVKWTTLIFLTTPLTFYLATSLFVDSIWTAYVIAAVAAFLPGLFDAHESRQSWLVAALLGFAIAGKFGALPFAVVLAVVSLTSIRRHGPPRASNVLGAAGIFVALASVPYATAWLMTGNPVFPFLNGVFQSPIISAQNLDDARWHAGITWNVLYRIVFSSGDYLEGTPGAAGFQWVLLFVPAVLVTLAANRMKAVALLTMAIVPAAITFQSISYLRYVFPGVALVCAALGSAIGMARSSTLPRALAATAVATVALNLLFLPSATAVYRDMPLNALWSERGRADYINRDRPIRRAVEIVNALNEYDLPVAMFSGPAAAGLTADALHPSWYNPAFNEEVSRATDASAVGGVLAARRVKFVIIENHWGTPEQRLAIRDATRPLIDLGTVAVRTVREDLGLARQLLVNGDFSSIDGWRLVKDARFDAATGSVLVSEPSPATQMIPVVPGRRYVNTVTARCAQEPAQGRVQVNWLDSAGRMIGFSIKVFDCEPDWTSQTYVSAAPHLAATAEVYASAHGAASIWISAVSFR